MKIVLSKKYKYFSVICPRNDRKTSLLGEYKSRISLLLLVELFTNDEFQNGFVCRIFSLFKNLNMCFVKTEKQMINLIGITQSAAWIAASSGKLKQQIC